MAVNRVTFTINSRQYTVVAEESVEYLERLCAHVNEKVENVLREGQNIMGERPIVLAALNICDEYYKSLDSSKGSKGTLRELEDQNRKLQRKITELTKELDMANSDQISIDETAIKAEVASVKNELDEERNKNKFLEGQIKVLEKRIEEEKARYAEREAEFLEMIEKG